MLHKKKIMPTYLKYFENIKRATYVEPCIRFSNLMSVMSSYDN